MEPTLINTWRRCRSSATNGTSLCKPKYGWSTVSTLHRNIWLTYLFLQRYPWKSWRETGRPLCWAGYWKGHFRERRSMEIIPRFLWWCHVRINLLWQAHVNVYLFAELRKLGQEGWITARNKIGKLDEYFDSWSQRLNEARKNTNVAIWLKSQIESYKVCRLRIC